MTMFNGNSSAKPTGPALGFPADPLLGSHENISCLLGRFGLSNSLDFLGKTLVFDYLDPQLRHFFPQQTGKVLSVLVSDPALSLPLQLLISTSDADYGDFISLDSVQILQVI